MYHPYLHGHGGELRAVRELAEMLAGDGCSQPVIDPVRGATPALRLALRETEAHGLRVWLITNTEQSGPTTSEQAALARDDLHHLMLSFAEPRLLRPTLLLHRRVHPRDVELFRDRYEGLSVGVVACPGGPELARVLRMLGATRVERVFFRDQAPDVASLAAAGAARCVWVERQRIETASDRGTRDGGLLGQHYFSDAMWRHAEEGLPGFSDYTSVPSLAPLEFPAASDIPLHLSCLRRGASGRIELWVEHFTSPTSTRRVAFERRLLQALERFDRAHALSHAGFGPTVAVVQLLDCLSRHRGVNRAVCRQWQLMHHLELVSGLLTGRFSVPEEAGAEHARPARVPLPFEMAAPFSALQG